VRALADHVTEACGGHGAARQWCDILLVASGRYKQILDEYLQ
jgi:3-deoxy-D-manno-octulosonate 8-phosphate phosphatase (KDO 8-P phosphatase)